MTIKTILYIIIIPLTIWCLDAINIEGKFKKNRYYQSRFLYMFVALGLSYLVVNCLYDFYINTKII